MTITDHQLSSEVTTFVDTFVADAAHVFQVFRETGALTPNGTFLISERVPGHDKIVTVANPEPLNRDQDLHPIVTGTDGTNFTHPDRPVGQVGFAGVLAEIPELTTLVHIHTPYLGAWASSHRPLPIRYAASQRLTLARELPSHIDRTTGHVEFITAALAENPNLPAVLEANGGATAWGREGLLKTAQFILLLEEGAQLQWLAESLGGTKEFGPGVLAQQWAMTGLTNEAIALGLLPSTN
jgi:hypothetical protein